MFINKIYKKTRNIIALSYFLISVIILPETALAIKISQTPPEVQLKPAPANFMIVLDDSGSMLFEALVDGSSDQGKFVTESNAKYQQIQGLDSYSRSDIKAYWRSRWAGPKNPDSANNPPSVLSTAGSYSNGIYYNPFSTYTTWKKFSALYGVASSLPNAALPPSKTRYHYNVDTGVYLTDSSGITASSASFATLNSVVIRRAHYFVWSENKKQAYLVNFEGGSRIYYAVDGDKNGKIGSSSTEWKKITNTADLPTDIQNGLTDPQDLQNFANWFTYYRSRWNTTIASITEMIDGFDNIKLGVSCINGSIQKGVVKHRILNPDTLVKESDIQSIGDLLTTKIPVSNATTPLRNGLVKVGDYYKSGDDDLGSSPIATDASGACQQNFTMVFTDGYWNDSYSGVGNADKESGSFSGAPPYTDEYSNTLADIAMYYYKTDLSSLPDDVPESGNDKNRQQHMVTYSVGLGLDGADFVYPNWPKPVSNTETTINDLHHAAVNGRGLYLSAKTPEALKEAFARIVRDVTARIGSAASVSINGEEISEDLDFYQSLYSTSGWYGDVVSKTFESGDTSSIPTKKLWSASEQLNLMDGTPDTDPDVYNVNTDTVYNLRKIVTYNPATGAGIPFRTTAGGITAAQKKILIPYPGSPEPPGYAPDPTDLVNYLRGDHRKEKRYGVGTYRDRGRTEEVDSVKKLYNYKIGDIVHSAPSYYNGVVYAGANDGMLHAFHADTGNELFAYVPNLVFEKLALYADSELYDHQYYVDATPFIKKITGGQTLLVGALGGGGKGIYCLNVTNVTGTITNESDASVFVKWEYPQIPGSDDDMGLSFSKPYLVNTKAGWKVIFGNGYNSKNGKAVLYIADVDGNGTLGTVTKIQTNSGGWVDRNGDGDKDDLGESNGLSTPLIVDNDADGLFEYVYAGDILGNLWKFNINDASVSNWKVSYGTVASPMPLFQAKNGSGEANVQPITTRPDEMLHCKHGYNGSMVVFATGIYLGDADILNKSVQGIYGIWDYGDDADNTEYIGVFNSSTGNFVSRSPDLPGTISMLEQELLDYTKLTPTDGVNDISVVARVLTNKEPDWGPVSDTDVNQKENPSKNVGWYYPLKYNTLGESGSGKEVGERVINDILIRNGAVIVTSMVPNTDTDKACTAGGEAWFYEIDACTGGRLDNAHIDANNDNKVNKYDLVLTDGVKASIAGLHYGSLIYPPSIARGNGIETKYLSGGAGTVMEVVTKTEKLGIYYWRSY